MVKQLNGVYKVKSPDLKALLRRGATMIRGWIGFRAEHVLAGEEQGRGPVGE